MLEWRCEKVDLADARSVLFHVDSHSTNICIVHRKFEINCFCYQLSVVDAVSLRVCKTIYFSRDRARSERARNKHYMILASFPIFVGFI